MHSNYITGVILSTTFISPGKKYHLCGQVLGSGSVSIISFYFKFFLMRLMAIDFIENYHFLLSRLFLLTQHPGFLEFNSDI